MRTVIFDIETNGLTPDKIWFIVCKDVGTGEVHEFHRPDLTPDLFLRYMEDVGCVVGHNICGYDLPCLDRLVSGYKRPSSYVDTLVVSRLLDTNISGGHSLEAWGERLGKKKLHTDISDWSTPTPEMLERCVSDVEVNYLLYKKFLKYLTSPLWSKAIEVEHFIADRCHELHENGFHFSLDKAQSLWYNIDEQLKELDGYIQAAFPPRVEFIKEVSPRLTKFGTINRSDFRFVENGDLSEYNGYPFSRIAYQAFNPGSPSQIVERLNEAGWKPTEKTKGHIEAIRDRDPERIKKFSDTGWTISEENLNTLPPIEPLLLWKDNCLIHVPKNDPSTSEIATLVTKVGSRTSTGSITVTIPELTKTTNYNVSTVFLSKIMREWLPIETDVVTFVNDQKDLWSITVTETDTFVDCSAPDAILGWGGLRNTDELQKRISYLTAARSLAKRIMLASRQRTLTEWINAYREDTQRIHGSFNGIGAWTHRMSHIRPNTGNIAREDALYGSEMRSMWSAPEGCYLVGVDAESIQLRVLAHYINDETFTQSLLTGKKEDGTDPHSLNAKALGPICASRNHAKTFNVGSL